MPRVLTRETGDGTMSMHERFFGFRLVAIALGAVALALPPRALATHFRYTHISWGVVGGTTVEFSIQSSFRRSNSPSDGFNPCVNPSTNTVIPCSGAGGLPDVGDVIREDIGDTRFFFGDGSPSVGSGTTGGLFYLVTAIDPANNWTYGRALDTASLPTIDTTIQHTYTPGTWTARIDSCCRISPAVAPNAHINNPDEPYKVEAVVSIGLNNASATTALPSIVICTQNTACSFLVPATDPDNDTLRFRLATASEADGGAFTQPGPPDAPGGASIDPDTGVYTWNTTGATLGPVNFNTLYSTQVIIEERDPVTDALKGRVAVDFFIQLVPDVSDPPVFSLPACDAPDPVVLPTGVPASFTVSASDPDAGDTVTLNVAGLPAGASMTPPLPTNGNPVSSVFSWTPLISDSGNYIVNFSATDQTSRQALCPVTLVVISQCGDGDLDPGEQCDTGSDVPGDCCTSSCQFEPDGTSCGGNPVCGGPSTCQAGICEAGAGGGDGDGDGVIDCADNCPLEPNADQADRDGDEIGNVCDDIDCSPAHPTCLNISKARLVGKKGNRPSGRIRITGDFVMETPVEFDPSQGFSVRVRERRETNEVITAAICRSNGSGTLCTTPKGPGKRMRIRVRLLANNSSDTTKVYAFTARLKRLEREGPFQEPVVVTLTQLAGNVVLVGEINDCTVRLGGIGCQEK